MKKPTTSAGGTHDDPREDARAPATAASAQLGVHDAREQALADPQERAEMRARLLNDR